jgi:glutamyl/glutaminyl-tRNA synthetase
VLLYEFLGWKLPVFIHVPNILGENKKKLSKREGDVSVEDFREKGYLPEAIVNFIALLGWNPKTEQEYFSLSELEKIFDVSGLHKAGAIFDYKKLDWMNTHYIKEKTNQEIFDLAKNSFVEYFRENDIDWDDNLVRKIVAIEKDRIKTIDEITQDIDFYFESKEYDQNLLNWKDNSNETTKENLKKALCLIENIDQENYKLKNIEKVLLEAAGDKRGDFLWPLRFALTSCKKSPSPFEVAWALGKDETKRRISKAISLL